MRNRRLPSHATGPQASDITLLCFSAAGVSSSSLSVLRDTLATTVALRWCDVSTVCGNETITDTHEIVDRFSRQIINNNMTERYALFGHSFGAVLAFETAHRLLELNYPSPVRLFVAGSRSPDAESERAERRHLLDDDAFLEAVDSFGGIPDEVREDPDLLHVILPQLRRDFALPESYDEPTRTPLSCPISVLYGSQDKCAPAEDTKQWRSFSYCPVTFSEVPGNHFFVYQAPVVVAHIIQNDLASEAPMQTRRS